MKIVFKVCGKRDPDTCDKFHNKYVGGILYKHVVKSRTCERIVKLSV